MPALLKNKIDYPTVFLFLLLAAFGWMNIFSSSFSSADISAFDFDTRAGKQLIWIMVSLILIIPILFLESHIFSFFSYFIYGFVMFLLIAVLIFGTAVNQSLSWFELWGMRIQPAEFAKYATALALAKYMGEEKFSFKNINHFIKASGIVLLPMLLILLQNDTGSALVFSAFLLVFYREGLHYIFLLLGALFTVLFLLNFYIPHEWIFLSLSLTLLIAFSFFENRRSLIFKYSLMFLLIILALLIPVVFFNYSIPLVYIIITAGIITSGYHLIKHFKSKFLPALVAFLIFLSSLFFVFSVNYFFYNFLSEYQRDRIEVFLGLLEDPKGVGYNVHQSEIAIGSGGLTGKGYLEGTQTKFDFVPEQDTDFIFCTVGEEWGFLGTSTLIILFTLFIYRLIKIAERQRSRFSRVFGYSVAVLIFFHFGVNIAMTIGLAPVIGIPLPFISYGGSSLWAFTFLVFTLLRLDMKRDELM